MVGYENIVLHDLNSGVLSISLAIAAFMVCQLIAYWYGDVDDYYSGLGGHGANIDYTNTPVLSWVKTTKGWEQQLTFEPYNQKVSDFKYEWKWITAKGRMGWVQKDPDPEVFVICSPGMRAAVDEILSKVPKETYK